MNHKEFEDYLISLSDDQYTILIEERINRLNDKQKLIAIAREEDKKIRIKLINNLLKSSDLDMQEIAANALRDLDGNECEHGRSYAKFCMECIEIDHLMFPELWDEDGCPTE